MSAAAHPRALARWLDLCALAELVPDAGVAALADGEQVALVRVGDEVYAVDNFDPFSRTFVIARGLVGDQEGRPFIASPMYKQRFDLDSGQSLDDPEVRLRVWPVRIRQGRVEILR